MRKQNKIIVPLLLLLAFLMPIQASALNSPEFEKGLKNAIPIDCAISVADNGEVYYAAIDYSCEKFTDDSLIEFGQVIYYAKQYYKQNCNKYYVNIYLNEGTDGFGKLKWEDIYLDDAHITDSSKSRFGEETRIYNDNDLFEYFPGLEDAIENGAESGPNQGGHHLETEPTKQAETGATYIVNKQSHKYHNLNCEYAPKEESKNYIKVSDSADTLESKGYTACKKCIDRY